MMKRHTFYSDQYVDFHYNKDLQIIELYWKDTTENMTEAEYRMTTIDAFDSLEKGVKESKWKCTKILADNRKFLFTMPPKLQEWQAKHVFTKLLELGLQKSAIIMSQELIAQFSIEQTLDEHNKINDNNKYFDNIQEAQEWLTLETIA